MSARDPKVIEAARLLQLPMRRFVEGARAWQRSADKDPERAWGAFLEAAGLRTPAPVEVEPPPPRLPSGPFHFKHSSKPSENEDEPGTWYTVEAFEPGGVRVGVAYFGESDGMIRAGDTEVEPAYRRMGVATGMYDYLEKVTGREVGPAPVLSADARAFWEARRESKPPPVATPPRVPIGSGLPGDPMERAKWSKAAMRAALASTRGKPSRWSMANGGWVAITPDASSPGRWRWTHFGADDEPTGHGMAADQAAAFKEAAFTHYGLFPEDTPEVRTEYQLVQAEMAAKAVIHRAEMAAKGWGPKAAVIVEPEVTSGLGGGHVQEPHVAAPVIPEPVAVEPVIPEPVAVEPPSEPSEPEIDTGAVPNGAVALTDVALQSTAADGDAESRDTRSVREVVIAPNDSTSGKGRSFRALLLASVEADTLWDGGATDTDAMRPVWAMFAGSDQELRPFATNLQMGRKAIFPKRKSGYSRAKEDKLELLKSAAYEYAWQREPEGSVVTTFLPDLFSLDPGMIDPKGIKFIMLPTVEWKSAQKIDVGPIVKHARNFKHPVTEEQFVEWTPLAFLFAAYLDRRTRCPIPPDGRFHLQLLLAALREGLASWSCPRDSYRHEHPFGEHPAFRFTETGTDAVGLVKGLAFRSKHDAFEKLLADEVSLFFRTTRGR